MLRVAHRPKGGGTVDGLGGNGLHELADLVRNAAEEEENGDEDDDAGEVGGGGDVLCGGGCGDERREGCVLSN